MDSVDIHIWTTQILDALIEKDFVKTTHSDTPLKFVEMQNAIRKVVSNIALELTESQPPLEEDIHDASTHVLNDMETTLFDHMRHKWEWSWSSVVSERDDLWSLHLLVQPKVD